MAKRRNRIPANLSESTRLKEVDYSAELAAANNKIELLQESLADVVLALDDVGWKPLGENVDATEIPLDTIKDNIQVTRGLLAINPLIKRASAVRASYIWGNGYKLEGVPENHPLLENVKNQKFFFSPEANIEAERTMFTDGNYILKLTKATNSITRLPLSQITGTVSDPENPEDVWFYKRSWTVTSTRYANGQPKRTDKEEYFPADDYDWATNGKPRTIGGIKVNYDSAILHQSASKQTGWKWGVADSLAAIFYSKAYKEFLETMATLTKAYARFAWKVTAPTKAGVNSAAVKVGAQPTRNPYTGEVQDVGATAVAGMGTTLSAVGRTGGSVDFGAGLPLAAMVAAALEIPLTTLTADAGSANRSAGETLEEPTLKAMEMRQKLWTNVFERVFRYFGVTGVKVVWPKISQETTLKAVQAIMAATPSNLLSDEEVREFLMKALGIDNDNGVPSEEDMKNLLLAATMAAEQAEKAQAAKDKSANPSYGDHSNRDEEGYHEYEPGTKN